MRRNRNQETEDSLVKRAVTTDLILSAEIMIISLDEVADQPLMMEFMVLVAVALFITAAVYGAVALLVKIDDIGLGMIERGNTPGVGRALVKGMPVVLKIIGIVGTVAMLWVGGHLIIRGLSEVFGWHWPHDILTQASDAVGGGALGWLVDTAGSTVMGLIVGFAVLGVVTGIRKIVR